jgi:hypothetical protein
MTTENQMQDAEKLRKEYNKRTSKEYYLNNKERILIRRKEHYQLNKERIESKRKERMKTDTLYKEHIKSMRKKYRQSNKERIESIRKERMKTDELYCATAKLRGVCLGAFQRIKMNKPTNTQSLLGCSWQEAKAHIESLFKEGMSWSNHGLWHIDHIRPVASFTLDDIDQMNHYTNLQPLWQVDNLQKGCKLLN